MSSTSNNFLILFLLIFISIPCLLTATDDYQPSELATLLSDFALDYSLVDEKGNPVQDAVNEIATIRILREEELSEGVYNLTLYIDRSFVAKEDNISLPYDFKWNFKGLLNGEYEFLFILKDLSGKAGVLRANISVQH